MRHSRTVDGQLYTFVYYGSGVVMHRGLNGGVRTHYRRVQGGRLLIGFALGGYLFNVRGDVVQRVKSDGRILHAYRYCAFGVELNPSAAINRNPFRFAGMYWDAHRGEYVTPNRMLNPRTGRWTQPDPFWGIHNMTSSTLAILQAANLYVFVMNNPIMFHDPSGLYAVMLRYIAGRDKANF